MIDPQEIRPGNWVIKITGTDKNDQAFYEYKTIAPDEYYYTFAKVCFPIKITPTVLVKCGFRLESGEWYSNKHNVDMMDDLPSFKYNHSDTSWYFEKFKLPYKLSYLHQLQNLFYALTNTELKIQLGFFANIAMLGPIDFFVKSIEKNYRFRELL